MPMACTVQPVAHHADTLQCTWSILVLVEAEKNSNWKGKAKQSMSKGRGTVAPCTIVPGVL